MSAFTSLVRLLSFVFIGATFLLTPVAHAASQTAQVGGTVTFSVSSGGSAPFTYQWRKDGVNIAGATAASYAISSAKTTDAGVYTVLVANAAGSTVSDN